MSTPIVIAHKDCFDGAAAAWVATRMFRDAKVIYQDYRDGPALMDLVRDHLESDIYIVDFSYPMPLLIEAAKMTHGKIVVIDHHAKFIDEYVTYEPESLPVNLVIEVNSNYSGSMLTWMHFFPGAAPLDALRYVQNHDLHNGKDPEETNAYTDYFALLGINVEGFETLTRTNAGAVREIAPALRLKQRRSIDWHIENTTFYYNSVLGLIPVTNAPRYVANEVLSEIYEDRPFAVAFYQISEDEIKVSLRSSQNGGIDVNALAKHYGGGGHTHAAGCVVSAHAGILGFMGSLNKYLPKPSNE